MRCTRSSDDQCDDYDGELQHLVVHHGGGQGGHHADGGNQGEAQCLVWACRACKRMRRVMDRSVWGLQCCSTAGIKLLLKASNGNSQGEKTSWKGDLQMIFALFTPFRLSRLMKLLRSCDSTLVLQQTTDFQRNVVNLFSFIIPTTLLFRSRFCVMLFSIFNHSRDAWVSHTAMMNLSLWGAYVNVFIDLKITKETFLGEDWGYCRGQGQSGNKGVRRDC